MFETERLFIDKAKTDEINQIIDMEKHPDNCNFVWSGSFKEHQSEIEDPNHLILVFKKKEDLTIIGYALIRLHISSNVFELRRIIITEKSKGFGKETIKRIIKYAFESLKMNRFWLDVYPDNYIGIRLYESLGMIKEGTLRQNYKSERGYLDQIIYSLLEAEYNELTKS